MKQVNVYEAKTHLSKLLEEVQNGEEVVIAKAGKPIADLKPHESRPNQIVFGGLADAIDFDDADFDAPDPEIMRMFYGEDWDEHDDPAR